MYNPRGFCGTGRGDEQERRTGSEAKTEQKAKGHSMQSTDLSLLIPSADFFQMLWSIVTSTDGKKGFQR